MTMTLEQVLDWAANTPASNGWQAKVRGEAVAAIDAHLTQPAQSVDAEKVREVIARVAADNQKSALTLGVEGLRGQCIETAKELHKLAAAL